MCVYVYARPSPVQLSQPCLRQPFVITAAFIGLESDAVAHPVELLNLLQPQGMSPHHLSLKVAMPIMLMHNLNPLYGLANGTRFIIKAVLRHAIQAEVITGTHIGRQVLILRIPIMLSDNQLPFTQFLIKPAFAITINKSQGQALDKLRIFLPWPVFSHGQLYVAESRVGEQEGVKLLVVKKEGTPTSIIDNAVYTDSSELSLITTSTNGH
nr:uncharacterized protein LOC129163960 [Nothobranchius furzeri]